MKIVFIFLFAILIAGVKGENYVQDFFNQKLDHFNFLSNGDKTFKQRYLYNDTWWDRGYGPIFFYTGNEGNIEDFWDNTGFMFRAARQFNALVLFAEHRYYGQSLPFGNDSFTPENVGLLSIEQALADYAFLLAGIKQRWRSENVPVISFGGSYGGMLAAYMRFKYPNIIAGAIAASAPLYQVAGLTLGDRFFQAVTKDFYEVSATCEKQVRDAYKKLQLWASEGQTGLKKISDTFHLCEPLKNSEDFNHLLLWSRNAFMTAALVDYPYPANFMGNYPANPVNVMCQRLMSNPKPEVGLYAANALLYNSSGTSQCFDIHAEYIHCADPTGCGLGFDSLAWDYQSCTEVNTEISTNGETDMFPVIPFNSTIRDEYCLKTWNVLPRRDYLQVVFWGADITSATNIVFSNGNLDPCAQGGILHDLSDSLVSFIVNGGAHHLDLREDNPKDPVSVRRVRNKELQQIGKWLTEYYNSPSVISRFRRQ